MPAVTPNQTVAFKFRFQNRQVNGAPLPEGTQVSYYLDIEDEAGSVRQYPPPGEPGLPDTPGEWFIYKATPADLGMGLGKYKVFARVHIIDPYGTHLNGERSEGYAPLVVSAVTPRFTFSWSALMAWLKSRS